MNIDVIKSELKKLGVNDAELAEIKQDARYLMLIPTSISPTQAGVIRKFFEDRGYNNLAILCGINAQLFEVKE